MKWGTFRTCFIIWDTCHFSIAVIVFSILSKLPRLPSRPECRPHAEWDCWRARTISQISWSVLERSRRAALAAHCPARKMLNAAPYALSSPSWIYNQSSTISYSKLPRRSYLTHNAASSAGAQEGKISSTALQLFRDPWTAANMRQYLDKRLFVQLNGSRKVIGVLRGFDVRSLLRRLILFSSSRGISQPAAQSPEMVVHIWL